MNQIRVMKYIIGKETMRYGNTPVMLKPLLAVLLIVMGGLLTACSTDDVHEKGDDLQLVAFTRTGDPSPETVTKDYSPVKLFLWSESTGIEGGNFTYFESENTWKSNVEVNSGRNYAIYGYAPATAATGTLSNASLTGATLTLTNVAAVTAKDVCVVIGVQQLDALTDAKNIVMGKFGFQGKSQGANYVNLLMDHVLSSVRFEMTIDANYAQLRSIKLKKMELKSTKGSLDNITVTLAANNSGTNPISNIVYGSLTATGSHAVFFDETAGVELNDAKATAATCCFAPGASNDLSLTTTYEVYDRYNNDIGERTVTNKLPNLDATRGQRVVVKLTVAPTYLGVLSDKDLDNPTIKIN